MPTDKQLAEVLWQLCQGVHGGNELEERVQVFVEYLGKNELIHRSDRISEALKEVALEKDGKQSITIESAYELSEKTIETLKKTLDLANAEPKIKLDQSLIGGAIVRTKDKIFDLSLSTQLNKLEETLKS